MRISLAKKAYFLSLEVMRSVVDSIYYDDKIKSGEGCKDKSEEERERVRETKKSHLSRRFDFQCLLQTCHLTQQEKNAT